MGNILSVSRAFEYCGADVIVTNNFQRVCDADYLVLPGVGAFAAGMKGLRRYNLDRAIKVFASKGRPMLGVCLRMQMLVNESEEIKDDKKWISDELKN